MLDRLNSIKVILTSGHEYEIASSILEPKIEKLKPLKPPNPNNIKIARRREKEGLYNCQD